MSMNVVILTAKGGNTSIENKNVIPILGVPVLLYPLRAAKMAQRVGSIYVTTEDPTIRSIALQENVHLISRPGELSRSDSLHKDVILHAVTHIAEQEPDAE